MDEILRSLYELKNPYDLGTSEYEAFKKAINEAVSIVRSGLNELYDDCQDYDFLNID